MLDEDNSNIANSRLKIRVPELTTKTFLNTILDSSKVSYMQCMVIAFLLAMYKNNIS